MLPGTSFLDISSKITEWARVRGDNVLLSQRLLLNKCEGNAVGREESPGDQGSFQVPLLTSVRGDSKLQGLIRTLLRAPTLLPVSLGNLWVSWSSLPLRRFHSRSSERDPSCRQKKSVIGLHAMPQLSFGDEGTNTLASTFFDFHCGSRSQVGFLLPSHLPYRFHCQLILRVQEVLLRNLLSNLY